MTRQPLRWMIWLALAGSAATAYAQPDVREHRRDYQAPPAYTGPTEAPPPPREERLPPRAGFVFIAGHWDWHGKWQWVPGKWEPERTGKHWRAGRWEQKDNRWAYTEGSWENGPGEVPPAAPPPAAPPPAAPPGAEPPPAAPPPGDADRERHHREWKIDRPTVSSYWPAKGKPGTHIVIHGRNFPDDAAVVYGGQPVRAAKVKPDEIAFEVPAGAASGTIELRIGHDRALIVGDFEVAAAYDLVADQRRLEQEQRAQAEAAWAARQRDLAKDRAAREQEIDKRRREREASREQRRADEEAEIQKKWERAFLADPDTQSELTLHAQRVAELERMSEMAQLSADTKLGVRIQVLQQREDARHQQRMAALHTGFQAKGGRP